LAVHQGVAVALVHASCIAVDGVGVLIRGPSGSGKSDLALRLIDAGAVLVCDDYCELSIVAGRLIARAPDAISGQLEVRGFGIVRLRHLPSAPISLVVDLAAEKAIERMPEEGDAMIQGVRVPHLMLDPRSASAAARVRIALRAERIAPAMKS
jgi:serine kinase of HPr protein (carbohydrate metabolism regulator)